MIYVAVALLLAGALLGAAGRKRWVDIAWRTWRPGAAILALVAVVVGVLLVVRGDGWEGALLMLVGAGLGVSARRRAARPAAPAVEAGGMGRREAASMLGLEAEATPEQVEEAYRRLIRRTHPDLGGSPGLAAQLNLARATLLRSAPKRGR